MRVLFYVPDHTGHHFAYLGRMLPGFAELPIKIVVATTAEAIESVEYSKSLAPLGDSIEFVTCCTPAPRSPIRNPRHRLRELVRAIGTTQPDHVMVAYVDGLWEQALLRQMTGRRPWPRSLVVEGWLYRGRFADPDDHRLKSRVRRWTYMRLLRSGLFRKLHLHHELLYDFTLRHAATSPTEVVLAPDPIVLKPMVSKPDARRQLGLSTEGTWISLAGMIARFKGAHLLLAAHRLRCEQGSEPRVRLLLAGPHEDSVRDMLQTEPYRKWVADGSIVSLDRFLDEDEMYASAAASDLVVVPYLHHQNRSSIVLWSAAAGRPSLGTETSCVGHVIRQERLGTTCNVHDPAVLADAITTALDTPWTDADVERVRKYAEFHRVENYQHLSASLLRERLSRRSAVGQPSEIADS